MEFCLISICKDTKNIIPQQSILWSALCLMFCFLSNVTAQHCDDIHYMKICEKSIKSASLSALKVIYVFGLNPKYMMQKIYVAFWYLWTLHLPIFWIIKMNRSHLTAVLAHFLQHMAIMGLFYVLAYISIISKWYYNYSEIFDGNQPAIF